ncbi:hypothetical protein C1X51_25475, partial [Pseudomonas sp. FW306-2-2C-B10A]|uniref:Ig-like domain-containing protein n=1 Tax=Pseudomonas sp. FW306-2-2C-B10A TaxID=2070593 RepID=UPI000CAE2765
DIVTYTWTGEVTGTTEDSVTLNGLSKDKDVHFTLNATFVAEHIEPNRGKKVTVSYRIWRAATSETSYSNVLEFGVGQAIGQLLPPAVKEADGGTRLDPLNAQTHLTAVVNYDGMLVGDQITAIWTGADGTLPEGSHTTAPWPVTTLGPQEIPLEPKVVAFSLGKAVTVNYKVTRGSSSPMPSDSLTLSVLPLPENVLDKPLILQAADNGEGAEFDVSQLTDNAVIQVNAWPFIALKQFVWLRVQGTNNDDSPYAQTFWQPPLSQTNETWITQGFYTHPIPFNELKNLRDGSELKVEFKAGLSGSQDENNALPFQVRTYTVKAVEDVKPAITRLTDSNGDEIAEGGSTVDTSITLTGTASKGQKIDVLDGTVSKGQPTADSGTGVWTLLVSGLSAGAHSFTAKALYGSGQSSAPRTLTVAVAVTPAIDSVTDSKGPVAQGGITFDRSVTVTGKASPNQKVRLLDGTTSLGEPTANGSGIWTQVVSALTVKAYSLKALALYGEGEESAPPFTFTVAVEDKPTIDSVKGSPSGVEIPNSGTSFETSVTLTGTASKGQKVQVLDGTTPKGQPTADATTGIWTLTDTGLALGPHSFTAKALYGSEQTSAARTFEIKPFVSFEDFQSLPEKELFLNEAPLETPALFLSLVQFQANGYAVVARFSLGSAPGKLEGNCIQGSGARVRLELKAPCSQVSFWQWTGDCTAVIYGVGGEILGEELLVSGESPVKSTFTFFGIKRIELIFRGQYCIVDTFSFSL